jgi:serine/threonine protein phosphatase PrpC
MTMLRAAGITDPGQVRTQNQDTFFVSEDLVLIADGMGGYAGGEVAAQIAADVVGEHFATDGSAGGLSDAVADANRRIYERGGEQGLEGMGTTLVALAVVDRRTRVLLANVGDSRAYLLRDGALRQLTEDHSVAAELVRLGRLEEEEGAEHPGRHVLTRALGVDRDVAPDLIELDPRPGDRVLLCSDGLSNELDDEGILVLLRVGAPSDAARALVAAANAHGGLDNITAVVADVVGSDGAADDGATEARGAMAASGPAAAAGVVTGTALLDGPIPGAGPDAGPGQGTGAFARAGSATTAVAAVATRPTSSLPAQRTLAVRPVLTGRERRRRRREDRRARRTYNKWVSLRGTVFLLAILGVLVGGFAVLRWYGTSNYLVAVRGDRIVVVQGQPGGFLWWPQRVVLRERYGLHQMPVEVRAAIVTGVQEPSLAEAKRYLANRHGEWLAVAGTTTTTTTTTTTLFTTGGT